MRVWIRSPLKSGHRAHLFRLWPGLSWSQAGCVAPTPCLLMQHGSVMISLARMLEADNMQFPALIGSDSEGFEQYCRYGRRQPKGPQPVPTTHKWRHSLHSASGHITGSSHMTDGSHISGSNYCTVRAASLPVVACAVHSRGACAKQSRGACAKRSRGVCAMQSRGACAMQSRGACAKRSGGVCAM